MKYHIRSRNEIEHDFKKWFALIQSDSSIYSWSSLAQRLGVSRSKVITSFDFHNRAKSLCEKLFAERLEETIIIVDETALLDNYPYLLDYHVIVPSPVFQKLKFLRADANQTAEKLYKLITTLRFSYKQYNPAVKRKINVDCWWAKIENISFQELPIEPSYSISLSQRSVLTLALNYMECGKNVIVVTSSYKLLKLINLQCDKSLCYDKQIHIRFKFIPPNSSKQG